ncbi:MAG TPA: hypothetical protein RMH99_24795 [Sandaracinaceae bacterium LLY-WYZ-13_1]|nr:hypothetical protein [Sandaracinaceae bacterium LLY-WYZ-13_1]
MRRWVPTSMLLFGLVGCTELLPADQVVRDGGAEPTDSGPVDAGPPCPAVDGREEVVLGEGGPVELTGENTWTCDRTYVLADVVFVLRDARLTIEPGVVVRGREGSMVVVTQGGRLVAEGLEERPITFTSDRPEGERAPGDWRGVILLGGARSNFPVNSTVHDTVPTSDARGFFSGGSSGPEQWSCGSLSYVRVEFAGGNTDVDWNPGAALTLAGCGEDTIVDHVHVHQATDGVGLLGGSVALRHLLVTGARSNGVEWNGGYDGKLQFVIVQQRARSGGALKGNNLGTDPEATPVSRPIIYNATLVGLQTGLTNGEETGFELEYGSHGILRNSIILGFAGWAVDIASAESAAATPGDVDVEATIFHDNVGDFPGGGAEPPDGDNDDGGFAEDAFFRDRPQNRFVDPELTAPYEPTEPVFSSTTNRIESASLTAEEGFATTNYYGALRVERTGAEPDWTAWATYPAD